MSVGPCAHMPATGYFFDAIIRQQPFEEDQLNVEENLEEFGYITDETLDYWERTVDQLYTSGKGIIAISGCSFFILLIEA